MRRPPRLLMLLFLWGVFALSRGYGFSLLGPFEQWQSQQLGYNSNPGQDVGAPKNLGEEFRWNVPVITYGVDRAFLEYFGTNGVRAIQEAFSILNNVPPASQIDPDDFTMDRRRVNLSAQATNLIDVKSTVLALMVEQLGLASAERFAWTLRDRKISFNFENPNASATNYLVINRNFDPQTFETSASVNGVRYTYNVVEFGSIFSIGYADAVESVVSPADAANAFSAVTSFLGLSGAPPSGVYLEGLTRDDVGGLRYLLNPSNLNFEPLHSGARPAVDAPSGSLITLDALRPGVDHLQFVPVEEHWHSTGNWAQEVAWTDRFYIQDDLREQRLKRVIVQPDILISAADLGSSNNSVNPILYSRSVPGFTFANRGPFTGFGTGPGILQSPVTITLAKLESALVNEFPGRTSEAAAERLGPRWGSFGSTGEVVMYPQRTGPATLRLRIEPAQESSGTVLLSLAAENGDGAYQVEASTDLQHWSSTAASLSSANAFASRITLSNGVVFFRAVRANQASVVQDFAPER